MVNNFSKDPELRFPEFNHPWKLQSLSNVCTKIGSGVTPRGGQSTYTKSGILFIRSQNVTGGKLDLFDPTYIPVHVHNQMSNSKVVSNDVLLNITGASLGRSCVVPQEIKEANVNQHVCIIRTSVEHPEFINYFLTSNKGQRKIFERQTGSGREGINYKSIGEIKIYFPEKREQQKITAFLDSVDKWAQELKSQKDELDSYKKVMMQKIFSQEIRFKEDNGKDFPDWEKISLEKLLKYEQPTKYLVESTDYDDSYGTPVLTAGKTFILGYTSEKKSIFEKKNLPVIIFDDFTTAYKFVDFPFKVKSSAMKILLNKSEELSDIRFIFYRMSSIKFSLGEEHKRYWISEYSKTKIDLPCKKEQIKITEFIKGLDLLIDNKNNQIQLAEQWKKGLMQEMFV